MTGSAQTKQAIVYGRESHQFMPPLSFCAADTTPASPASSDFFLRAARSTTSSSSSVGSLRSFFGAAAAACRVPSSCSSRAQLASAPPTSARVAPISATKAPPRPPAGPPARSNSGGGDFGEDGCVRIRQGGDNLGIGKQGDWGVPIVDGYPKGLSANGRPMCLGCELTGKFPAALK